MALWGARWASVALLAALCAAAPEQWAHPDFRDSAIADQSTEGQKKMASMLENTTRCDVTTLLYDATGCGIFEVNSVQRYVDIVLTAPRPYDLFVLYTVRRGRCCSMSSARVGCRKECEMGEDAFLSTAASYHALGEHGDDPLYGDRTFFAIVRCDRPSLREICEDVHEWEFLPQLSHVRSHTFKRRKGVILFRSQHLFVKEHSADTVLAWVNGFTRKDVVKYSDLFSRLKAMIPLVAIGLGLLVLGVGGGWLVRRYPSVMVVGAVLVQWIGCSGITFNLLHGLLWSGPEGFFANSTRSQYVGEGLLCSGLFSLTALLMLFAVYLGHLSWDKGDRRAEMKANAATVGALACIGTAAMATQYVFMVYQAHKATWYSPPPFYPPAEAKRGSLGADRGMTFINDDETPWYETNAVVAAVTLVTSGTQRWLGTRLRNVQKLAKRLMGFGPLVAMKNAYVSAFDMVFNAVTASIPWKKAKKKKKKKEKASPYGDIPYGDIPYGDFPYDPKMVGQDAETFAAGPGARGV